MRKGGSKQLLKEIANSTRGPLKEASLQAACCRRGWQQKSQKSTHKKEDEASLAFAPASNQLGWAARQARERRRRRKGRGEYLSS